MALDPSSGWSYYKEIQISDTADVSADYQMKLTVYAGSGDDNTADGIIYCDNHCEDFPNDIRFGTTNDPSTATQLAQWIEESDATSATIWVKCPSDGSNTFYMFVGNSSASQYSDGDDTFLFFDDFEGTSIDTSKWEDHSGGSFSVSNSILTIVSNYSSPWRYLYHDLGAEYKIRLLVRARCISEGSYAHHSCQVVREKQPSWFDRPPNSCWAGQFYSGTSTAVGMKNNDGDIYRYQKNLTLNEWYRYFVKYGDSAYMYKDDYSELYGSATGSGTFYSLRYVYLQTRPQRNGETEWDFIAVMKFADPEPAWSSFGSWTEISAGQAYETTLTDTISLSDSTQKLISILRSDNFTLTDSKTITPAVMKSDSLTLSDSKLLEIMKLLQDSLSLTDIKIVTPTVEKSTAITLTDELSNMLSKLNSEQLVLIENLLNSPEKIRKEIITLTDAIKNQINLYKSELINLQDSIATTIAIIKEEIISLSDSISKLSSILKSESIPLSDSIITEAQKGKLLEETINLLDSLIKTIDHLIEDNFTISDSIEKQIQILRQDSLSLTDSITKTAGIEKSEEITTSDLKQLQMQTIKLEAISILIENLNQINLTEKETI
ncbi:MAG: hypothetical protein DRN18_04945, partial [Thermoplasmata archaeon]